MDISSKINFNFSLKFHPLEIPFNTPITINKETTLTSRNFILIKLLNEENKSEYSFGFISPLEGVSEESIDEILNFISSLNLSTKIFDIKTIRELPKLIQNGVEEALLHYAFKYEKERSLNQIIKICSLSTLQSFKLVDGKKCYKIKIGHSKKIIEEIKLIDSILNEDIIVRLDPNNFLSNADKSIFLNFLQNLPENKIKKIEYIEDFVLPKSMGGHFKLALDFDLFNYVYFNSGNEISFIKNIPQECKFIIIKPALWGIFQTLKLIEFAKKKNITPILSSCYDHPFSLIIYSKIISHKNIADFYHGLDTLKFFSLERNLLNLNDYDINFKKIIP